MRCPGLRPEGSKLLADWAFIPRNEYTRVHTHASLSQNVSVHACFAASVVSDSSPPHGLEPARLLCPWDTPDKNTGVGCHAVLQGIFLTQESDLHLLRLLHYRQIVYC